MPENAPGGMNPEDKRARLAAIRAAAQARRAAGGATPEDPETDVEAQARAAAAARARATGGGERPFDPRVAGKGSGRKTVYGQEFTGQDPTSHYYPGEIAPALAGERAKAVAVVGGVKDFIEKYHTKAVDRFYGSSAMPYDPRTGAKAGGERAQGRGTGVAGYAQMMNKDKALKLVDDLPMMSQDQMFGAARALGNYIWKIHGTARKELRQQVRDRLGPNVSAEDPQFQDALKATSKDFDTDSVKIKGDLNLLAAAAGALKRSGGKLGPADATFLTKKPRFAKPPEVVPKEPTVSLPPGLRALAGQEDEPAEPRAAQKLQRVPGTVAPKGGVRPVMPLIRKKHEAIDRWVDEVIEHAVADRTPHWWDEI